MAGLVYLKNHGFFVVVGSEECDGVIKVLNPSCNTCSSICKMPQDVNAVQEAKKVIQNCSFDHKLSNIHFISCGDYHKSVKLGYMTIKVMSYQLRFLCDKAEENESYSYPRLIL